MLAAVSCNAYLFVYDGLLLALPGSSGMCVAPITARPHAIGRLESPCS